MRGYDRCLVSLAFVLACTDSSESKAVPREAQPTEGAAPASALASKSTGDLTRDLAKRIIIATAGYPKAITNEIQFGPFWADLLWKKNLPNQFLSFNSSYGPLFFNGHLVMNGPFADKIEPGSQSKEIQYEITLGESAVQYAMGAPTPGRYARDPQHLRVLRCVEQFGAVTGITGGESDYAEVQYTTSYKGLTPFAQLPKKDDQCVEGSSRLRHATFRKYDDGWRPFEGLDVGTSFSRNSLANNLRAALVHGSVTFTNEYKPFGPIIHDMRKIGSAWERFAAESNTYTIPGQRADGSVSYEALKSALIPTFAKDLPERDLDGHPYVFRVQNGGMEYVVTSPETNIAYSNQAFTSMPWATFRGLQ